MLNNTENHIAYEDILRLFQETDRQFKDTDKKFQETDKKFQDTDKKFQETDRQMKNLMKKMSESETRWGKFIEALVEGTLLKVLKKRNIKVEFTAQRVKGAYNNRQYEFDIIAKNGVDLVVVEVKTTLSPDDVKQFLGEMKVFKNIFPEWNDRNIFGGVAYINIEGNADVMAEKQGLFVIKATNDSAKIINAKEFLPKKW